MFNMENYRTSTRWWFFAQLHIFQEQRGSDRLPGSRFVHAQHGGWTAGSRTVIQEPLAPAVEADGQPCPPSLQLTEKLMSNLERNRALSNNSEMEISKVSSLGFLGHQYTQLHSFCSAKSHQECY